MAQDDPGGVFASDAHRRVMANAPNPDEDPLTVDEILGERVSKDNHLDVSHEEAEEILKDLEADGHVRELKNGWKNTASGWEALTGDKENENARSSA
jgi:hypothetical protein